MFLYSCIIFFLLLIFDGTYATKSNEDESAEKDSGGSNVIWIVIPLVIVFIIATCVYICMIVMAIKRKACFKDLDVAKFSDPKYGNPNPNLGGRQSAGADKISDGKIKNTKKKDPSVNQSIQHQTAAHEYDNFGNLTTEETKTNVTKEDNKKKTTTTVSKQQIESKTDKDLKKPPPKNDEPPPAAAAPTPAPETPEKLPPPQPIADTTKKPDEKKPSSPSKEPPQQQQQPQISQAPLQESVPPPAASIFDTPMSICGTENIVEPIIPQNSSDALNDNAAAAGVPSSGLQAAAVNPRDLEPSFCQMLRDGTLRKERPGLFCDLIVSTVLYVIFNLCLIVLGILTSML